MADDQKVLGELVALKRRRAEQRLAAAQIEVDRAEAAIQRLVDDLKSVDHPDTDFEDRLMSLTRGRTAALTAQIAAGRAGIAGKLAEVEVARDALKRALFSEGQINEPDGY